MPRRRLLWTAVIFLALIGVAVAARRIVVLIPVVSGRVHPAAVAPAANPRIAQLRAADVIRAPFATSNATTVIS